MLTSLAEGSAPGGGGNATVLLRSRSRRRLFATLTVVRPAMSTARNVKALTIPIPSGVAQNMTALVAAEWAFFGIKACPGATKPNVSRPTEV